MEKIQGKFTFNKGIRYTPYNHSSYIKQEDFDISIRGIIYQKEKTVYLRINDLTSYNGIEYKKVQYRFDKNLKDCIRYLESNYKGYGIYTSYTIDKLPFGLKREVLSC